jgi:flagellar biosynthetic protein FliP
MTVIDRTSLGPRQGLAAVRIGERVVVVSIGDGGVHHVTDLSPDESKRIETEGDTTGTILGGIFRRSSSWDTAVDGHAGFTVGGQSRTAGSGGFHGLMQRGLKSLGMISLIGVLALSSLVNATVAHAQSPVSGTTGVTASAMVTATTVAQQTPTTPSVSLQFGSGEDSDFRVSGTVGTVLFMGLLATLPTLLLLMTSFTRVLVVLHFARQALGTQGAPPAHLLAALALLMTGFIMAPTIGQANDVALQPWMRGEIDEVQMMKAGVEPFRTFMLGQTTDDELARFVEMSGQPLPDTPEEVSLPVLMTAFATGELRAAFQMGFAIFLPFVVIDLVVSAVLTSMGMFMLPPTMIALPIKLLLFVLVDGWSLLVGSLISSFV